MQTTAVAKISRKGQVVIPAEIRRVLNVKEGDKVIFQVTRDGKVIVTGLPTYTPESIIGILPHDGELPSFEELRRRARRAQITENESIMLDPNSWEDAEWYYEDEDDIYAMMQTHKDEILVLAEQQSITVKQAIDEFAKMKGIR
jgi:antitoxin PrlF